MCWKVLGGGQIGYQRQFGHWVFGIEGDFDRTSIRDSAKFRDSALTTVFDNTPDVINSPNGDDFSTRITADTDFFGKREAHTNWIGSVRGKAGYATGPLLFYATAGVAFAGVDVWAHDVANTLFDILEVEDDVAPRAFHPNPPGFPAGLTLHQTAHVANTDIEKDDDVMVGYTAGAGLEIAFNDAVSLALEYRHNGFGDETYNFNHHNNTAGHGGPIFPGATNLSFDSDQLTVRMNVLLNHFFGNGAYASVSPAKNNVAVKSPFGEEQTTQVAYTKAKDADKWSGKDKEITKVEEPFNWTGFYIGANAGGAWTDYDFNDFDADVDVGEIFDQSIPLLAANNAQIDAPQGGLAPSIFVPFSVPGIDGGSDDSVIGGGQAGYQHQWNHWVFGVEADFQGLSTSKSTEYVSENFGPIAKNFGAVANLYTMRSATIDWQASARAKIGYARGPVMLYLTGGAAWANVRMWATDKAVVDFVPFDGGPNFNGRSENNSNDEDTVCGWTAGGGAEWAFTKIASIAMEYRHTEFDSADAHYDPHHSAISAEPYSVDLSNDQVTVRLNLLLGHVGPGH